MQPDREIISIQSTSKAHLVLDPNAINGARALAMFSGRGGRVTGWFSEEGLAEIRDAITQTLDRTAVEDRLARFDPTTTRVGPVVEPMALAAKGNGKSTEIERLTVEGERRRAIEWWDLLSPDQQEAAVVAMARLYASIQAVRG